MFTTININQIIDRIKGQLFFNFFYKNSNGIICSGDKYILHKYPKISTMLKTTILLLPIFLLFNTTTFAQNDDTNTFIVGHSLSDYIGEMVQGLANDADNKSFDFGYQQILGSPLRWQWQARERGDFDNFPDANIYAYFDPVNGLASGQYDKLILTEGVPRYWHEWSSTKTHQYVDSFYLYATQYRPDIQVYIYELWHCLDSGTPTGCDDDVDSNPWRQRLSDDLPLWESFVDTLNVRHQPTHPAKLIPAGQALARLYDEIEAGNLNGISRIRDVFEDRIHGNDIVRYLVACTFYATLYEQSPSGLTNQLYNWWGGAFGPIPEDIANKLQEIAWKTVCNYYNLDSSCSTVSSTKSIQELGLNIFPNPSANGNFQIKNERSVTISNYNLYDLSGKIINTNTVQNRTSFSITVEQKGIYILQLTVDGIQAYQKLVY